MTEKIEIDKEKYNELIEDQKFLQALFLAGVDNWEGYEEAQRIAEDNN